MKATKHPGRWNWADPLADPAAIAQALLAVAGTPAAREDDGHLHDRDRIAAASARYFPNVELVDQDGRSVRFYDDLLKDKVVLLDFVFTGCSEACSTLTENLPRVQELLANRADRPITTITVTAT